LRSFVGFEGDEYFLAGGADQEVIVITCGGRAVQIGI
jgi:hypothetical protein